MHRPDFNGKSRMRLKWASCVSNRILLLYESVGTMLIVDIADADADDNGEGEGVGRYGVRSVRKGL